jgi:hypothetical protein
MQGALRFARQMAESHGLTHALLFTAILHLLRREEHVAREYAEASIAIDKSCALDIRNLETAQRSSCVLSSEFCVMSF